MLRYAMLSYAILHYAALCHERKAIYSRFVGRKRSLDWLVHGLIFYPRRDGFVRFGIPLCERGSAFLLCCWGMRGGEGEERRGEEREQDVEGATGTFRWLAIRCILLVALAVQESFATTCLDI